MRLLPMTLPLLLCLCACADRDTPAAPLPQASPATPPAPPAAPQTPASPAPAPTSPAAPVSQQDVPSRFRGRYAGDAAACAQPVQETALDIQARRIEFHEGAGDVIAVRSDGDEIAIDAGMTGEGETWQRTYRFRLEADDNALVDAESGLRRVRCPAG
jgi:hypothetical protein